MPFWDMELFAKGEANRHNKMKVFDWDKAAEIMKERDVTWAAAGLKEDWEYTGGTILRDGKPVKDSYTYLASTWATPTLRCDNDSFACWIMEDETDYGEQTKWPEKALEIMGFTEDDFVSDEDDVDL